ncbi:hypothetical protein SISNIDRAFT_453407 [Sistotremastrum niveocremeum HHB9708]|uniref:AB hydrolase-1 domain-containing protein n=2 Tax=Sistotremastraceae TaxID=3402574 RepID=A0A164VUI5_9AGAM|nr:hypothetical protein SISNIDRAFT_453407 [Sistotremastrum niveocremeum HHB9708]KZT43147.1 hypothetical protein SISSUDRAFT_1040592 [Sistotremastrum suecicum HHB10207 ss-3]
MYQETFVVEPRPGYPYHVSGTRYTQEPSKFRGIGTKRGLSVIFLHATGLHKETWQPAIECLLRTNGSESATSAAPWIEEAWSIECPNHGQSFLLNAEALRQHYNNEWPLTNYAQAVYEFVTRKPGGHDIISRNLVGVGHSVGAVTLILLSESTPRIPFQSIVLCDPFMGPISDVKYRLGMSAAAVSRTRQDVWLSRGHAEKYFQTTPFTRDWAPETKALYCKYAVVDHPASQRGGRFSFKGVTLACPRDQEAEYFRAQTEDTLCYQLLAKLYARKIPVHLIHALRGEKFYAVVRKAHLLCHGQRPTSVRTIDSEHMHLQLAPSETAALIADILFSVKAKPESHEVATARL